MIYQKPAYYIQTNSGRYQPVPTMRTEGGSPLGNSNQEYGGYRDKFDKVIPAYMISKKKS